MIGKRSLGLIVATLAVAIAASATPIRPDIKKLLNEPVSRPASFAPARAGWHGPEMSRGTAPDPLLQQLSPAATHRQAWQSIIGAAVPDVRIVVVLLLGIVSARLLANRGAKRLQPETEVEAKQRLAA